jgi:hypothetical protein
MTMHKITDNFSFDEAIPAAAYATASAANSAASEIDKEDAQNVVMYVSAGTVDSTLTVTLQGATSSGGSFADLTATDGNAATVTLSAAGDGKVEVRAEELKRYLKPNVEALTASDEVCVAIVAGNYESLPVS